MKFITNKISTGKAKSFEDIVASYAQKRQVKVASTDETVKVAEADEADSSGQLDVEPLHQTGESTTMPKNGPSAKKDDSSGSSPKEAKEKDEADSSGQTEVEGKLINDPKVDKEAEVKEAGELPEALKEYQFKSKGEDKDEDDKEDKDEDDKEEKDDDDKEEKTAGKDERGKRDGTGPYKGSLQDKNEDEGKMKQKGEECPCEDKEEEKEASSQKKFIRLANLDSKSKSWLSDYWKKIYPADYVDAMLSDK